MIITDKVTSSASKQLVKLEPINVLTFVDVIRAAEILKWHVDLVNPFEEKIEYLEKVGSLVDYFRVVFKGVGGTVGLATGFQTGLRNQETDISFSEALSKQKRTTELRELIGRSNEHRIKFLWARYTFWVELKTIAPFEQNVRLILATDSERDKISAIVYVGSSPYGDENEPGKTEGLEG